MSELDARMFRVLHDALSQGWLPTMAVLTTVGGGWGALTVFPLFASRRTRSFAGGLTLVLVVTNLLVFGLKRLFERQRPCHCLSGVHALVFEAPHDPSFPSGHAAGAFAFATFVAAVLLRRWPSPARFPAAALLLLVATGIAISRVALGVHFPGDITAGALLGTLVGGIGAHAWLRAVRLRLRSEPERGQTVSS